MNFISTCKLLSFPRGISPMHRLVVAGFFFSSSQENPALLHTIYLSFSGLPVTLPNLATYPDSGVECCPPKFPKMTDDRASPALATLDSKPGFFLSSAESSLHTNR